MSKEGAPPNGAREPIRIAQLSFLPQGGSGTPTQGGPHDSGLGGLPSAIRAREVDEKQDYQIEHQPWLRRYRILNLKTGVPFGVHEHRVSWTQTVTEWQEAQKAQDAKKVKAL
jgi:hypothetical protein